MELIERESILAALNKEIANGNPDCYRMDTRDGYGEWMHSNGFNCGITHAIVAVKTSVKYDAVPVIRCKDCKHWFSNVAGYTGNEIGHCEWANWMVGENGYCVYGERKDETTANEDA